MARKKSLQAVDLEKPLGYLVDQYYSLREERYELQRQAKLVEEKEKLIKEHIINTLPKSETSGVSGKLCRVTVVTKSVPSIVNFEDLQAYIRRNASKGAFALLQRRLNESAVKEIWESGKKLPGVEPFQTTTLSVNKL